MKFSKKLGVLVAIAVISSTVTYTNALGDTVNTSSPPSKANFVQTNFKDYIKDVKKSPCKNISLNLEKKHVSAISAEGAKVLNSFENEKDIISLEDNKGWVEWKVNIPKDGFYYFELDYMALEGSERNPEVSLSVDGDSPYYELTRIVLNRLWESEGGIKEDSRGNDLIPIQKQANVWHKMDLREPSVPIENGLLGLQLKKGQHTVRLTSLKDDIAVKSLRVHGKEEVENYEEYLNKVEKKELKKVEVKIQAENVKLKSDASLVPNTDNTSAKTSPSSASKRKLNTFGKGCWTDPGQWATWEFEVPEDGMYKISSRFKNNFNSGMFSTRKVYVDGKVPFKEFENIKFPYGSSWQTMDLGAKDKPYEVYLTKGKHEISMEVVIGDLEDSINVIEECVLKLNNLYRKVIMVTGASPDSFREYKLDKEIPGLMDGFKEISESLKKESKRIGEIMGTKGGATTNLDKTFVQLDSFLKDPDSITKRLDSYKSNMAGLSDWMLSVKSQELDLDYIKVSSLDTKLEKAESNFFQKFSYGVKRFIASFHEEYDLSESAKDGQKTVKVWVSTGRDQAQIIKELIDNDFTPKTGIHIDLALTQASLIDATLAGKGPDVSLQVSKDQPVNLAMRGALIDLTEFKDFNEVTKRFADTAMVPYKFKDSYYGLPVTQSFGMMFYRKDILNELGLEVPKTWEDLYKVAPVIQKKNMNIGFPYSELFTTMVLQRETDYYKKDLSSTNFDDPKVLESFKEWTDLYDKLGFPLVYDFYNRFRSGEMPLAIAPYTTYNQLVAAAPEIRGLWEMAPIMGTEVDGTINRSENGLGTTVGTTGNLGTTSCIMLKNVKEENKETAWEFMKWWTSEEIQAKYGLGLERLMGPAARYDTANINAFKKLPWSNKEIENIEEQWKWVKEIPQVPGGTYFTPRGVDNAFKSVVLSGENQRESLSKWNDMINKEIERKRREFGVK